MLTLSVSGRRRAVLVAVSGVALMFGVDAAGGDVDGRGRGAASVSGYVRLADHPAFGGPLLAGEEVLVGSRRNERAALTAYSLAGVARDLPLASPEASVGDLAASSQAMAVTTRTVIAARARQTPVASARFGPLAGPLQPFPARPEAVAVAGSIVLALEGAPFDSQRLVARDIAAGAAERLLATPQRALGLMAAGTFAAVIAGFEQDTAIVVLDVQSGSELYRVPARVSGWGLGPDGRAVLVAPARGRRHRIITATPQDPRPRTIARLRLFTSRVAVSATSIAVVRRTRGGLGEVVLVNPDGSRRAITPALNRLNELSYDGRLLAFNAGHCVFAGPVPAGAPAPAPRDKCFDLPASLDFRRLDQIDQTGGRTVRVPLRCQAPPKARCPAHLRLSGTGFRVRRRVRIAPGLHEARLRIPVRHRFSAWRTGMSIETREHGRSTAGAAIPR